MGSVPSEYAVQDLTMAQRILIVDDEPAIRQLLVFALAGDGYLCEEAGDMPEAQRMLQQRVPDLILLDWMLPGISGVDFARRLRREQRTSSVPIIMLTARAEEADKIRGLDSGADDFITKPFSTRELLARVRAQLRRVRAPEADEVPEAMGIVLNVQTNRVSIDGAPVDLSPTEFRLLHFFMTHAERVYTRAQLLDEVWGNEAFIEERTVDVHIRRLRKILEPHARDTLIQTIRSVGYRFSVLPP